MERKTVDEILATIGATIKSLAEQAGSETLAHSEVYALANAAHELAITAQIVKATREQRAVGVR